MCGRHRGQTTTTTAENCRRALRRPGRSKGNFCLALCEKSHGDTVIFFVGIQPGSQAEHVSGSSSRREELSMRAQDMTHAPATSSQPIGTLLVCLPSSQRPQVRSAVRPSVADAS